jgi:hypothetical protein
MTCEGFVEDEEKQRKNCSSVKEKERPEAAEINFGKNIPRFPVALSGLSIDAKGFPSGI